MNIIEREIKAREDLIASKAQYAAEIETLKQKIAEIDVDVLTADIEELKAYLPKPEVEQNVEEAQQPEQY